MGGKYTPSGFAAQLHFLPDSRYRPVLAVRCVKGGYEFSVVV